MKMELSLK